MLGTTAIAITGAIAGDGDRVWLETGDGTLSVLDLASPMPTLAEVGGAQSEPASHYLWATEDTILGHNGFEVTARAKTDGELLWSQPATGYSAAVRGDGDLVVWTSLADRSGRAMSVLASDGFGEPETIMTVDSTAGDLVLTDDALYVLYTPGSGGIVVRLERPDAP